MKRKNPGGRNLIVVTQSQRDTYEQIFYDNFLIKW